MSNRIQTNSKINRPSKNIPYCFLVDSTSNMTAGRSCRVWSRGEKGWQHDSCYVAPGKMGFRQHGQDLVLHAKYSTGHGESYKHILFI
jgi:hypothetical protein